MEYTYNFHNLVGIRLEGASPANAAAISRQYGRTYSPLVGEPDITIRFSGDSARPPALRTLGLNEAAYTDDAFFVVRGKGRAQAMARFPFEAVGEDDCTIECINGPAAILSLLTPLLNLTMLRRGIIPLHATAFNYQGRSVIATGWSRSGKTETLLSFMANGADYVGDEYIYLQDDGRMFAIPPLTLWEWHLPDLERYWRYVEPTEQRRIKRLRRLIGIAEWGKDNLPPRLAYVAQSLEWIRGEMRRRLATKLWPQEMFGEHAASHQGQIDTVLFTVAHTNPETRLQRIDASEVVGRMVYSMEQQRQHFRDVYLKYKFAFPANTNALIEEAFQREKIGLARILAGKEAYALYHPPDAGFEILFETVRSIF